ncbi:MAG: DUF3747 domain-containing protein [Oscillatoriales cyanobacterium RM2_1_1]|nr:DUF3747 domain-containing protein [Oscillatoriales cyanobacterium SM2_3_0]NJO45526.1 DUF3747 domain-containing protein [Oscillatoriales cyanobacterium RM2_1_1]
MGLRAKLRTAIAGASFAFLIFEGATASIAVEFGQREVDQERFVAIAVPRRYGYSLVIVEQVSDTRPCWQESGNNPTEVDPLLLTFDFTGICGRATDSNGYSLRMGGRDLALTHTLSIQSVGGDILLVASSRVDVYAPLIIIGRTYGMSNGFTKIILEPGWRFAKRTYDNKTLGHIYFTNDLLSTQ